MNLGNKKRHREIKFVNVEQKLNNAKKLKFPESSKCLSILNQSSFYENSQRCSTKINPALTEDEKNEKNQNPLPLRFSYKTTKTNKNDKTNKITRINKSFKRLYSCNKDNIDRINNLLSIKKSLKNDNNEKENKKNNDNDNYISLYFKRKSQGQLPSKRVSYEKRQTKNIFLNKNKFNMDAFFKEKKPINIKKKNIINIDSKNTNKNDNFFKAKEITKNEAEYCNNNENKNDFKEKGIKETKNNEVKEKNKSSKKNFNSFKKLFCCCL